MNYLIIFIQQPVYCTLYLNSHIFYFFLLMFLGHTNNAQLGKEDFLKLFLSLKIGTKTTYKMFQVLEEIWC
jgi:hypothetical protein